MAMKMVFCYKNCSELKVRKNCSSDREKLLKFETVAREFIQTVKSQNNLW